MLATKNKPIAPRKSPEANPPAMMRVTATREAPSKPPHSVAATTNGTVASAELLNPVLAIIAMPSASARRLSGSSANRKPNRMHNGRPIVTNRLLPWYRRTKAKFPNSRCDAPRAIIKTSHVSNTDNAY